MAGSALAVNYAIEEEFSELERHRVEALELLIRNLKSASSRDDQAFARLFEKAMQILELEDLELARRLQVSRPTIGRWTRGESAPHPLGRGPVFRTLAKIAEVKLRHHVSSRRDFKARSAA